MGGYLWVGRGGCLWVVGCVGVWLGLVVTLTHAHSTYTDPHFNPYRYQTDGGWNDGNNELGSDLSDHLALEFVGSEEEAKRLADKYHLHYLRQVFVDPPVYHLHRPRDSRRWSDRRREKRSTTSDLVNLLAQEPGVTWVDQQRAYVRDKRDRRHIIPSDVRQMRALLDDLLTTRRRAGQAEGRVGVDGYARELRDWAREEEIGLGNIRVEGEGREGVDADDRNLQDQAREGDVGLENIRVGRGGQVNNLDKEVGRQTNGRIKGRLLDDSTAEEDREPDVIFSEEGGQIANLDGEEVRKTNDWIKRMLTKETEPKLTFISSSLPNLKKNMGETGVGKGRLSPTKLRNLTDSSFRKTFGTSTRRKNQLWKARQFYKRHYVAKYTDDSPITKSDVGSVTPGREESAAGRYDVGMDTALEFNDPLYRDQWYLVNRGQVGSSDVCDLNVTWAWRRGYTGKGVTVSILDDGVQTTNQDIHDNYAPEVSYSVVKDSLPLDDPSPRLDPPTFSNSHGTYCAGVVAAVADNGVCGVGVAYKARVGGVRIVDGSVTDIQEATALFRHINTVDVFSASWGPPDDGTKVEGPGKLAQQAFEEGVMQGRGGLGVIYVWACGNGGLEGDNCNVDGYASSIYTLSVSALTSTGASTFYEEPCASTMAGVYVGGSHTLVNAMKRDRTHAKAKRVVVPELDGHCSQRFQGSSAAAPLMSGVIALVLQANPKLGWRDVQHLVARLATPTAAALKERGWSVNARGRAFHLMQGFGAVDGGRLVEAALTWQNVGPQQIVNVSLFEGSRPMQPHTWLNISGEVDQSSSSMTSLEHVVATISINHPERRLLEIFLISPAGTQSQVLTNRPKDQSGAGFNSWKFMSIHFWGEDPRGEWRVAVRSDSIQKGYLKKIWLQLYGT